MLIYLIFPNSYLLLYFRVLENWTDLQSGPLARLETPFLWRKDCSRNLSRQRKFDATPKRGENALFLFCVASVWRAFAMLKSCFRCTVHRNSSDEIHARDCGASRSVSTSATRIWGADSSDCYRFSYRLCQTAELKNKSRQR